MGRKSTAWKFTCRIGKSENNYTKEYALDVKRKIFQMLLDDIDLRNARKKNEENDK
ncbi:hypothetical protein [Priestia koreensis]|uniref:hypothetical protein n=1 Tax=Priestia koreensis TaxID=284581 RepID=UPI000A6F7933|nr:hypothetical protein [Priestia koreensis]